MTTLETNRLSLIIPQEKHAEAIVDYYERNRAHLRLFEPLRADEFYTVEFWRQRIAQIQTMSENDQQVSYLFTLKPYPELVIGIANFTGIIRGVFQACFLGYSIDEHYEGQGLMFEALDTAIKFMFEERNFHRIMANCMASNVRSLTLLDRLGFDREGIAKDYLFINGKWEDHITNAITNPNWIPAK